MLTRYGEKRKIIRRNKALCKQFPFLRPWDRFSGDLIENYDYSYTELNAMPEGWRKRFGIQMCHEIRDALIDVNDLYRWRIVQMKEKYGVLCLYDNGSICGSRVPDIIDKYENMSAHTCIKCGADATRITMGWIAPYCDKCCPGEYSVPISEYYKEGN